MVKKKTDDKEVVQKPARKASRKVAAKRVEAAPAKPAAKKPAAKTPPVKKPVKEKKPTVAPIEAAEFEPKEDPTHVLADQLGLTPKQKRFCDEYLIDLNGTQAAIRTGYSEKTANEQAARLLANVSLKKYIDQRKAEISEKTGITQEVVLKHWYGIATADANELVEFRRTCCRYCYGKNHRYQRTPAEMERDRKRYANELAKAKAADPKAQFEPFDEEGGIGFNRVKDPNLECPECRGEGAGDAFFKDTRNLSAEVRSIYAGVKIGKDGIEVKMHSKDKALEMLARHLKMFDESLEVNHTFTATKEELDAAYQRGIENAQRQREEMLARRQAAKDKG